MNNNYNLGNLISTVTNSVLKAISFEGIYSVLVRTTFDLIKNPENFKIQEFKYGSMSIASFAYIARGLARDYKNYAIDDEYHIKDFVPYVTGFTVGGIKSYLRASNPFVGAMKTLGYEIANDYAPDHSTLVMFGLETGESILNNLINSKGNLAYTIGSSLVENLILSLYIQNLFKPVSKVVNGEISHYFDDNIGSNVVLFGEDCNILSINSECELK